MKTFKKAMSLILAMVMLVSMTAVMAGCGSKETVEETVGGDESVRGYSVSVKSMGGMALEGIDIYVYADNTLADLVTYGETDAEGNVSFQMAENENYAIVVSGTPKGYEVAESYSFSGNSANLKLKSSVIKGENLAGASLGLGDIMYDFSVVTPAGETVTLSEMLEEKKMVLMNFWYTTCTYCVAEFPYMEEAYQQFIDDILHGAHRVAFHESIHLVLGITLCQNVCRCVESYIADVQQLCNVTHLCAVTAVHTLVSLYGVGISQLLCFVNRHTALHQLLHVVTAKKVADFGIDNAVRVVLRYAVETELLCEHQHGGIHIDTGEHLFNLFLVVVNNAGVLRHSVQTDEIQNDLIHFFYCHSIFLLKDGCSQSATNPYYIISPCTSAFRKRNYFFSCGISVMRRVVQP